MASNLEQLIRIPDTIAGFTDDLPPCSPISPDIDLGQEPLVRDSVRIISLLLTPDQASNRARTVACLAALEQPKNAGEGFRLGDIPPSFQQKYNNSAVARLASELGRIIPITEPSSADVSSER